MLKVKKTFVLSVQADYDCSYSIRELLDGYGVTIRHIPEIRHVDEYKYFYAEYQCAIESSRFEGFLDYLEGCVDEDIDITVLC